MQQLDFQHFDRVNLRAQANHALSDRDLPEKAVNDDSYDVGHSPLRIAFTVLLNVFGGALLFATLVILPHVVAGILG